MKAAGAQKAGDVFWIICHAKKPFFWSASHKESVKMRIGTPNKSPKMIRSSFPGRISGKQLAAKGMTSLELLETAETPGDVALITLDEIPESENIPTLNFASLDAFRPLGRARAGPANRRGAAPRIFLTQLHRWSRAGGIPSTWFATTTVSASGSARFGRITVSRATRGC